MPPLVVQCKGGQVNNFTGSCSAVNVDGPHMNNNCYTQDNSTTRYVWQPSPAGRRCILVIIIRTGPTHTQNN